MQKLHAIYASSGQKGNYQKIWAKSSWNPHAFRRISLYQRFEVSGLVEHIGDLRQLSVCMMTRRRRYVLLCGNNR